MLMDTVKKKLGYMVRSERERRGLSQAKLAEQAGVSTRTISDIETCNGNPELATLIPIAQFLDISIDAAVQDERKEPDTTTYQIMKELQNCSEDERQIALRTLRGLLSALKEKDLIIRMKSVRNLCGICGVPVNWHKCATKKKHSKFDASFYFLSISKCTHCISNAFGNFRCKDKFRYLLFLYFFFHLNILLF